MKKIRTSWYWLLTLGGALLLQLFIGEAFLTQHRLQQLFPYNPYYENAGQMANAMMVMALPAGMKIGAILAAFAYNYRAGRVLLNLEGRIVYCAENLWASLLCSLAGSMGSLYFLQLATLGMCMFTVSGSLCLLCLPMLAVFVGWARARDSIACHLSGAGLMYCRSRGARTHTFSGAFRDMIDWSSRGVRLVTSLVVFSSVSMGFYYLMEGPFAALLQEAHTMLIYADPDSVPEIILNGSLGLAFVGAPYLPIISGSLCAVAFDKAVVEPLYPKVHPAVLLLAAAPVASVFGLIMLMALLVASSYSMWTLIFVGMLTVAIASRSPVLTAALVARMVKHRGVLFSESVTLKVILLVSYALLALCLLGG